MAKGCICGKATVCAASKHPNVSSGLKVTQTTPVQHIQRRPGETFSELKKRLGMETK